ncbi:hypothetical protein GIB67_022955 [Kingdonia uniflora]|uniref:Uncharacterized protein n=1 Tax=Kingdonia uniflora TaxID=39325 RepID=A0A7J7P2C0_9MAGN|nr:hypothetical protein GIB67_022955 [Kingdonia uniflora]
MALFEALEKFKGELMVTGFISLILTIGQVYIGRICIPIKAADSMLPCPLRRAEMEDTEEHRRKPLWNDCRFLAVVGATVKKCKTGWRDLRLWAYLDIYVSRSLVLRKSIPPLEDCASYLDDKCLIGLQKVEQTHIVKYCSECGDDYKNKNSRFCSECGIPKVGTEVTGAFCSYCGKIFVKRVFCSECSHEGITFQGPKPDETHNPNVTQVTSEYVLRA